MSDGIQQSALSSQPAASDFPRLERIALENFAVPFAELSPKFQWAVRQKAEQEAAKDMLAALKAVLAKLNLNRFCFEIPVEEQMIRAAIAKAEGRL